MKSNFIGDAVKNIRLSNEKKAELKRLCVSCEARRESEKAARFGRLSTRILAVAAIMAVMTLSVFAVKGLIEMKVTRKGDEVRINVELGTEKGDTDAPLRAWNSDDELGEISVRLGFDFMPEDLTEDSTATHKYSGSRLERSITFSGYDLRRSDFDTVVKNISECEKLLEGEKEAFLLTTGSADIYNKDLYVLFNKEELLVHAYVGYGISDEEIRLIAEGMYITETENVDIALPIANEGGGSDTDIPFVIEIPRDPVYVSELLKVGEMGFYENEFSKESITVESYEILDNIRGINKKNMYDRDIWAHSVGAEGDLTSFIRTEVEYRMSEDDRTVYKYFGESVEMTKRFVTVTVSAKREGDYADRIDAFLNTFNLYGLLVNEKGEVSGKGADTNYVVDHKAGYVASSPEIVYFEELGDGRFKLGYLIDVDSLEGDLYFHSSYADIGYILN